MHPVEQPESSHRFAGGHVLAGRFRVVRLIGRGGMGEVYEAFDQELKEIVALKLIRAELANEPRRIARFKQEIRNARRISHPNVCRVYDLFQAGEGMQKITFLTMEFVAGETLLHLLRRETRLTPEAALPLARQICAGLQAAHQHGIVHRDLKPGNVLLSAGTAGRAVISDFGLAFDTTPLTDDESTMTLRDGGAVGTPAYMAPEQIEGAAVSPATDIYALGLVLYEMVTGQRPFSGATPLSEAAKRLTEAPKPPDVHQPGLPDRWKAVILRCLVRDPAGRMQSAAEVSDALDGKISVPAAQPVRLPRRKLIAALAALSVVAGLAYFWPRGAVRAAEAERLYQLGISQLRDGAYLRSVRTFEDASKASPKDPMIHARLAEAWSELDSPEFAREAALKIPMAASALSSLNSQERLHVQAIQQTVTRDFPAAIETFQQALRQAPASGKSLALIDLGRAFERNGNNEEALRQYQEAARLDPGNAWAKLRQAVIYAQSQDAAKFAEMLGRAETLYRDADKLEGLTEVNFQRGRFAAQEGRLPAARQSLAAAQGLARTAGNAYQQVRSAMMLSRVTLLEGKPDVARAEAEKAIEMAQAESLEYVLPTGLMDLGYSYSVRGDIPAARNAFTEALRLSRKNRDRAREALSLLGLGVVNLRDPAAEEEGARQTAQALEYLEANRYRSDAMVALINLGRYRRNRGEYDQAIRTFASQVELARQARDTRQQGFGLDGLASVHFRRDEYTLSEKFARQSREAATRLNDAFLLSFSATRLAESLARLGRFDEADALLAEAAKPGFPTQLASIAAIRAEMALTRRDTEAAHRYLEEYRKLDPNPSPENRAAFHRMMAFSGMVDRTNARRQLERSLQAAHTIKEPVARAAALALAGEGWLSLGDNKRAFDIADPTAAVLDKAQKLESSYRAHLLLAEVDAAKRTRHLGESAVAWDALTKSFGDAAAVFARRPDIAQLRKQQQALETRAR